MPKLNRKKLSYKKVEYRISDPSKKTGGFYNNPYGPSPYERGYHTYDYFGPTPRRHEGQEEKKVNNDEDELSL